MQSDALVCEWHRLPPELLLKIAARLWHAHVATCVKLIDKSTAAALRDGYRTITLKRVFLSEPVPWPARDFTRHWGRPEPWRALQMAHRQQVLLHALFSGDGPSLEVAWTHCECPLEADVLYQAVSNSRACTWLLERGCSLGYNAVAAAAMGGHLQSLQVLLEASGDDFRSRSAFLAAAVEGACIRRQPQVLTWLQQEHGCSPAACLAAAGASAAGSLCCKDEVTRHLQQGHPYRPSIEDALDACRWGQLPALELLMSQLPEPEVAATDEARAGEHEALRVRGLLKAQRGLLVGIAERFPVEVLRRHHDTLWRWQRIVAGGGDDGNGEDAAAGDAGGGGAGGGAGGGGAGGRGWARERDRLMVELMEAAATSYLDCWAQKLDWLSARWGRRVAGEVLRGERGELGMRRFWDMSGWPDLLQRLRHLQAAGLPLTTETVKKAATSGLHDVLVYLLDECGMAAQVSVSEITGWAWSGSRYGRSTQFGKRFLPLLKWLHQRGAVFTAEHVTIASKNALELEPVIWLAQVAMVPEGTLDDITKTWCSAALSRAASSNAPKLAELQSLKQRGATVTANHLAQLCVYGSVEALEWAAAELDAQGGESCRLKAPTAEQVQRAFRCGNAAALLWLRGRGLLPQAALPTLEEVCSCSLEPADFWSLQLLAQLQPWSAPAGPPVAGAPAAAAGAAAVGPPLQAAQVWHPLQHHPEQPLTGEPWEQVDTPAAFWARARALVTDANRRRAAEFTPSSPSELPVRFSTHFPVAVLPHQMAWMERQAAQYV